jgi:hypothetical protein
MKFTASEMLQTEASLHFGHVIGTKRIWYMMAPEKGAC